MGTPLSNRSTAVCDGVGLEMEAAASADMGKLGLDGFAGGIFALETLFDDFFHDGNVIYIPEQAVHMNHIFQRETEKCETFFHLVKGTVDLLLNCAADNYRRNSLKSSNLLL